MSPSEAVEARQFGAIGHTFQPPREIFLPHGEVLSIVPEVNEQIFRQCYSHVFVEGENLPAGFTFSLFSNLRVWMNEKHPRDYRKVIAKAQELPDREYQVLGDPLIHAIMPLLPPEDQSMLLHMGRRAFKEDFNFEPKGLWLPETAVSTQTLNLAAYNGYEFVVLRDTQVEKADPNSNPVWVKLPNDREIAVVHFDSGLSRAVSIDNPPWAIMNADNFLSGWIPEGTVPVAVGTDTETFGHHRDAVEWLRHVMRVDTLDAHGFKPMSIKDMLASDDHKYSKVIENSSWSCEHGCERWTGECDCGGASIQTQDHKKQLFRDIFDANTAINRALDGLNPGWRREFTEGVLNVRSEIFSGKDFITPFSNFVGEGMLTLMVAKVYTLLGMTSCGWFFGEEDSPTRKIPEGMISVLNFLIRRQIELSESVDITAAFAVT